MALFNTMSPEGWLAFAAQMTQPTATRGNPIGTMANAYLTGNQVSNAAQQQAVLRQKQQMEMEDLHRSRSEQDRVRQVTQTFKPTGATPYENLMSQVQFFRLNGMFDQAMKTLQMAEKYKPEFKTDIRTELVDGKPVTVLYGRGGERQVVQGSMPYERPMEMNLGGTSALVDPLTRQPVGTFARTQSPDNAATVAATHRGQNMTDARAREYNGIQQQAARTQIIDNPITGPMLIDKGTGQGRSVTMNGQTVQGEKTAAAIKGANDVLSLLSEAEKYIDNATGSYLGAGVDFAARAFGSGTKGAQNIARLKAIEGALLSKMPRMEGPQSNYDVQNYRQAVGQIGDPTVPPPVKRAAMETVKDIQRRYAGVAEPEASTGARWVWNPRTSKLEPGR